MKEILDHFIETGEPTQVHFKMGPVIPGALRKHEDIEGMYVVRVITADKSGQPGGMADVVFDPDSVYAVTVEVKQEIVTPTNMGKIIVPGK